VVQRTCQTRLFSDKLAAFTFWGWQAVLVGAVITLPMGFTSTKEYAELEWPLDILITLVWVAYAVVFFGTIAKRRVRHIYVANWFFGSYILTIAVLHIFNNLEMPVSLWKSYSVYSGVQDAMVQWWYGHNAVGFFLTTSFLGMMYYFVPKQAERPIYSYRLSIVHFWALAFTYMWAGPHHLLYTSLPDWTQSLGMALSLILLAPSWGGMINGIMTLSGAWHGQCPVALHRLDRGPRAFGRAGLGGHDHLRLALLHDSTPVWPQVHGQHETGRAPFLDRDPGRGALHRFDVDCRCHARADVARHRG
jgi:cytochrome c oxidase cbb3-type subunit 1